MNRYPLWKNILMGLVLLYEPQILHPLERMSRWFAISDTTARLIGVVMLAFVALYSFGS